MSSQSPEPYHREMGQMMHGDTTEAYAVPNYVAALVIDLLSEYSRVYANHFQQVCPLMVGGFYRPDTPGTEGEHLLIDGLAVRSYWWGDPYAHTHEGVKPLDGEQEKPNLEFDGVRIYWYKHAGRGMSTNVSWTPEQWAAWYDDVLTAIQAADVVL
jgi:hypothetical protein